MAYGFHERYKLPKLSKKNVLWGEGGGRDCFTSEFYLAFKGKTITTHKLSQKLKIPPLYWY